MTGQMKMVYWNQLPVFILAEIYAYLPLKDRLSASVVCSTWATAFHSPSLWDSVHVRLNGCPQNILEHSNDNEDDNTDNTDYLNQDYLEFNDGAALSFAENYGNYLKRLNMTCDPQRICFSGLLQQKISQFLSKLTEKECVLKEMRIILLSFSDKWQPLTKHLTIDALMKFTKHQKQIELFYCDALLFEKDLRLLETLLIGNALTLQYLCFPLHWTKIPGHNSLTEGAYYDCLAQIPNLLSTTLSLESLSRRGIEQVLKCCPHLNTLCLRNFSDITKETVLEESDWSQLCSLRPELRVDCFLKGWTTYGDFRIVIPPTMPLRSLVGTFKEDARPSLNNFPDVIEYITNHFANTLVALAIGNRSPFVTIDNELLDLVKKCFLLSELTVVANLKMETLFQLCELQMDQKIDLRPFSVARTTYTGEENLELLKLYDQFGDVFDDYGWVFS